MINIRALLLHLHYPAIHSPDLFSFHIPTTNWHHSYTLGTGFFLFLLFFNFFPPFTLHLFPFIIPYTLRGGWGGGAYLRRFAFLFFSLTFAWILLLLLLLRQGVF
ncbi:hypothetical protein HOY80DRAFT_980139 [Tuber brumale]|nr:hypothetical protein HOY80DRAFT_980139 [Tuber brumale]